MTQVTEFENRYDKQQREEEARSQKIDAIISGVEGLLTGRLMIKTGFGTIRVVENPDHDAG